MVDNGVELDLVTVLVVVSLLADVAVVDDRLAVVAVVEGVEVVRRVSMEQSTTNLYFRRNGYPKIISVLLIEASYPQVGGHRRIFETLPDQLKTGRAKAIEHPLDPPSIWVWSAVNNVIGDTAVSKI